MREVKPKVFVSAKMVAERAGVSRSAVSRTFTDGASVSEETRRKVMEAAEALGYHVNHLARQLRERSNIVCLIVSDMTTPVRAGMLESLTRKLQAAGKITMVINTESNEESVGRALKLTLHYRADATVVLSGTPSSSLVHTALANGQQVVLINRDDGLHGAQNVGVDNGMAAKEALFLLRRAGCRRIGLLTSQARTPSLLARERCFTAAASACNLDVTVFEAGPTGYRSGYEAARRVFARSVSPDGVFCVTDLLALGFMDGARQEFGLKIPEDLCVIGFDNIEQAGWEAYQLTTFEQPLDRMAAHVVDLLTLTEPLPEQLPEQLPGRQSSGAAIFEPLPVWRRSVRAKPA
ncbi:substrate-binding domain-containing protein [Pannonibacter indicus]|uniref:Transcriptional regulator, LacI family n=1 Tax=Pannonibacter indicus TaxID=466044 RepID=A0A0K6I1X2_9HYPH|nr:substrate-binding domain-containing protein [Pannonibacter indicus]CUA97115.1 transcriptional regulator, LacI family [Pannonibacter indicus]